MKTESLQLFWFQCVNESTVRDDVRDTAYRTREHVCRDLTLPPFTIVWTRPISAESATIANSLYRMDARLNGRSIAVPARELPCFSMDSDEHGHTRSFTDGKMWIRSDLSPSEVMVAVMHESRHLWQRLNWGLLALHHQTEECERDAYDYEKRIPRWLMPTA